MPHRRGKEQHLLRGGFGAPGAEIFWRAVKPASAPRYPLTHTGPWAAQ